MTRKSKIREDVVDSSSTEAKFYAWLLDEGEFPFYQDEIVVPMPVMEKE